MTQEDLELRRALEPLAGDPVTDAARVLSALPHPGVPPVAWWFLGVGLAAGLLCTVWVTAGSEEPKPEPPEKIVGPEKGYKEKEKTDKPPNPWAESIYFYGLGKVEVTEPEQATEPLSGEFQVAMGSRFRTGPALAGLLLEGEVMVRINRDSEALVTSPVDLGLTRGSVFVVSGQMDKPVVVTTPGGVVDIHDGRSVIDFDGDRLQVVCLAGWTEMHVNGRDPVKVPAGSLAWANTAGQGHGPAQVKFMPRHTGWMTKLIVLQQDVREREQLVHEMVKHYYGTEFRDAARSELMKLGSAAVGPLAEAFLRQEMSQEFARATAKFICNTLASRETILHLFQMLHSKDPEVRIIVYESLYRMTEDSFGTGDSFWRAEGPDAERERAKVIQGWWEQERDR